MVPGAPEHHLTYRSELMGLLTILVFIEELCTFHNISSGGITIGCDGLSALQQAEGDADIVPLSTKDFASYGFNCYASRYRPASNTSVVTRMILKV